MSLDNNNVLLRVENLMMHFPIRRGVFQRQVGAVRAVDGVSFDVKRGETLGLVGESGCGKSTTGRTILQLYKPTAGEVSFEGVDLVELKSEQLRQMRRKMQMIFQDSYASLNPRMTVGQLVGEPLMVRNVATGGEINERVMHLLELVKLNPAFATRYPHEFSGGQRQRIGVARALALQPSFIICDEPISALDVSIQAQVVNLQEELQQQFNLTHLFIAHDLSMVKHISDRIAVMLWFAYTQQNQWQVYAGDISSPFRETNYMPELFGSFRPGIDVGSLKFNLLNFGYTHQSNGRADPISRSWDRLFVEGGLDGEDFALIVRAWTRIELGDDYEDDNPDILDYMGHGQVTALYRWRGNSFTLMGRGNLSTGKGAAQFTWASRPVLGPMRVYFQLFSGYGESLIDYDWNQTTVGLGVTLNDLL